MEQEIKHKIATVECISAVNDGGTWKYYHSKPENPYPKMRRVSHDMFLSLYHAKKAYVLPPLYC